jgi:hypothetical protein
MAIGPGLNYNSIANDYLSSPYVESKKKRGKVFKNKKIQEEIK